MNTDTEKPRQWPESSEGLQVARAYARWHLGYSDWADTILYAYLNPAKARERLSEEMDEPSELPQNGMPVSGTS